MMRALAKSVVLAVRGGFRQLKRQTVKRLYAGRHAGARRARQTLARELPAPPFRDALEREAFVEWSGFVSTDMLTALQAEAAEAEAAQSRSKDFFELLSPGRPLRTSDASVRIALDPSLVAAVTAYFGEVPYLLSSELIRSRRTAASPAWKKSQLWHFDHNDTRVLKLFVYLNDVGDDNGPFTYIPMHPAQAPPLERPRRNFRTIGENLHARRAHALNEFQAEVFRSKAVDQQVRRNAAPGCACQRLGNAAPGVVVFEYIGLEVYLQASAIDRRFKRRKKFRTGAQQLNPVARAETAHMRVSVEVSAA